MGRNACEAIAPSYLHLPKLSSAHSGRVERRTPAFLVVAGEVEIVALAGYAHGDVADAGPGVEPRAQRPERAVVGPHRAPGESDSRAEELAALVEHGYSIASSARALTSGGMVSPRALAITPSMMSS